MKMAKASEADLDMAMELCGAMEALTSHWPTLPTSLFQPDDDEPDERFYCDDDRQCGTVLRHLLAIAERASLGRVIWGCAVMLDPRNKLVDPSAETIERHPHDALAHEIAACAAIELLRSNAEPGQGPYEWLITPCQADDHMRQCVEYLVATGRATKAETCDGYWVVQIKEEH